MIIRTRKKTPLPLLLKKAEKVFNAYIRKRDAEGEFFQCISCGNIFPLDRMNAGHYVPVHNGSVFRFNEWNVNGECQGCNGFDQFHLIGYRKRLVDKVGIEAVMFLEDHRRDKKKWTRSELEEIISKYK